MLKGKRLTLRPMRREDMESWWRDSNDVELQLLSSDDPPEPSTLEGWQAWYEERIVKNPDKIANFSIEIDGEYSGSCSLSHFDTEARCCELGIYINKRELWGKGYGREAIGLLLDYAFRLRNQNRVWLSTSGENERALRCYRACGFVEEGRQRQHTWKNGRFVDSVFMGILREEWKPQDV